MSSINDINSVNNAKLFNEKNTNPSENLKDKFKNTINNYSSIVIVLIIILLSIIIQVGYYIAWILCDTYFFSDNKNK